MDAFAHCSGRIGEAMCSGRCARGDIYFRRDEIEVATRLGLETATWVVGDGGMSPVRLAPGTLVVV